MLEKPQMRASDGRVLRTKVAEASIARHRARTGRARALKIERWSRPIKVGELEAGDRVRHASWGDGAIVRVDGANAVAAFPGHGEKLIRSSFLAKIA